MYCTLKLRNETKEAFDNVGADVPTNDLGSVILNENLRVEKIGKRKMAILYTLWLHTQRLQVKLSLSKKR
jgi:hypothetical protein